MLEMREDLALLKVENILIIFKLGQYKWISGVSARQVYKIQIIMSLGRQPIRNLILAYVVLLATNIAGGFLVMPVFLQLLLNTCCCVYIGCLLSTRLAKDSTGKVVNYSKSLEGNEAVIGMSEAKQFPLVASAFLFGIYILYKFLPKQVFMGLVNSYFSITIVMSISSMLVELLPFPDKMKEVIFSCKIPSFLQDLFEAKKFELSIARILCIGIVIIPVGFYFVTKHWALNNIFGVLFSVVALKSLNLSTTRTGLLLLWALFFYDIFWVYGTDVMVTVAKNLDLPIKLVFPFLNAEQEVVKSMVGLGDIVLPGLFISFCLKFDIDQAFKKHAQIKSFSEIQLNYFNMAFAGYFYGIVETFLAMFIFQHPQPALLFLVPMCTIPVLLRSIFRGQFRKFVDHDTELIMKEEIQEDSKQKKQKTERPQSPPREIKRD